MSECVHVIHLRHYKLGRIYLDQGEKGCVGDFFVCVSVLGFGSVGGHHVKEVEKVRDEGK